MAFYISSTPVTWTPFSNVTHVYDNSTAVNGTDDNVKIYTEYMEYKVSAFLLKYYLFAWSVIGIPGNICSIITFSSMRPLPSSVIYMVALSVVDTVNLSLAMLMSRIFIYEVRMGDGGCQWYVYLGSVFQQYSNWILVALTVQRFIASWSPLKVKTMCTGNHVFKSLIGILAFFLLANVHFIFTYEQSIRDTSKTVCSPRIEYEYFHNYIWKWIDGCLYAILPIILISVFNGLIIRTLRKAGTAQRQLTTIAHSKGDTTTQQLTTMLLTISIAFIILTLPNCLFFIVREYWSYIDTQLEIAQHALMFELAFVLTNLNYVVNFYLYFLSGKKFRQRFLQVLCRKNEIQGKTLQTRGVLIVS